MLTLTTETSKPILLTDNSRLQEIYNLRVDVWGHYEKSQLVNRKLFPDGWRDGLDENGFHWIITNEDDKIIAAARLNIFNSLEEFPYFSNIKHLPLPESSPFAFYSRLVIHPGYRGEGRSFQLAKSRMRFCEARKINWSQVYITNEQIKRRFMEMNFHIIGQAEINYHKFTPAHSVNVFIQECNF